MSAHVRERLAAYLDGEVDPVERSTIDAHLALCRVCSTLLQELALVDSSVAALPRPETRDDGAFAARVRARIEAEDALVTRPARRSFAWRALPAWTWAAAAALLVAAVTPLTLRELRPSGARSALDAVVPERPMRYEEKGATEPQAATPPVTPSASRRRESVALQHSPAPAHEPAPRAPNAPVPAPRTAVAERVGSETAVVDKEAAMSVETGDAGGVAGGLAEEKLRPARAKAAAPASSADARGAASPEEASAFGRLSAQRPRTAEDWRRLREAWRDLARSHPGSALADEALVRAVEAAAEAYRASADPQDEGVLQRDVAEYLAREDAAHGERVRLLLREDR